LKYLAKVFLYLRKTGFIFYQMAYLESGLKDSYLVKRASPGKSSVQVFRDALQVIRNEIGAGSLVMAEQTAYAPVVGFADIVSVSDSFNNGWDDKDESIVKSYPISDLIEEETVFAYSWIPGERIGFGKMDKISVSLQPHEMRLFWLSEKDEPPPQTLSLGGVDSKELI